MDIEPTAAVVPIGSRFERWRDSLVAESPITRELFRLAAKIATTIGIREAAIRLRAWLDGGTPARPPPRHRQRHPR